MFTDDRQALWWSPVAGSFLWCWREAGSPCDGPWWLGASSGTGERQAVPVMVPGGWYCTGGLWEPWLHWYCAGGLWGALASLVLCWGVVGSPGLTGTVLGGYGEPWLCWYCAGAVGSPGFAGTVLEAMGSPGFAGTVLGGCGEPWLHWYFAGGLWGALALLGNLEINF